MSMRCVVIPVTTFQQNCSLIWCEETAIAAVIDPGGDIDLILETVEEEGITLEMVLITHGHVDHAGGAADLEEALEIPIIGPHQDDEFWIKNLPEQAHGFQFPKAHSFTPQRWLKDGDVVEVGQLKLEVLHCPGHTPGHVVFFHRDSKTAFVGDVLFKGSIGRTDFPRSNHQALLDSIRDKLWPLGDDVIFISGHGASSTFGEERMSNPFVGVGNA
jgi:glyoxylase-like metal-dependent hydrolase (beta-lactamase superfamily II)